MIFFISDGLRNSIRDYPVNLLLVISGLLPCLGRKSQMLHHTVKRRITNPLDLCAMMKRDDKNGHSQKKFEDAHEPFERIAPYLRAFLLPFLGLEFSDCFAPVVHNAGGILYS
jgi:hypothetical protein